MAEKDNVGLVGAMAAPPPPSSSRHLRRASLTLADDPAALEASGDTLTLKRSLTALDLSMIGISGIVGAGIYVLTGSAAALYAGPSVVISFIIAAIGCSFSCLCYSELASVLPVAGSAYSFSTATLGSFIGFVIGFDLTLEYLIGAATVGVGWSGYFASMLKDMGISLPVWMMKGPLAWDHVEERWVSTGGVVNLPAVFIIGVLTAVNYIGIQESARFTKVVVSAKILVLLIFIFAGFFFVNSDNWKPFIPPAGESFGEFGVSGIFRASSVLFFSFIGADSVSTAAQESLNPQRDVPIGTLASLGICSCLYIAVGFVLTGLVSYKELNAPDPIAVAVNAAGDGLFWLRPVVKVGALLGLTSVIMVLILGQSRIWFAMSADGMLPPFLAKIHPKYKTPSSAVVLCGVVAAFMAAITPIDVLGEMVSIGTLLAFVLVCSGVLVLRRTKPNLHRPFKTPWVPYIPILGILTATLQMVFLPWGTWARLIVWLLIGLCVYHFYSKKHAKPMEERLVMMLGMKAAREMMQAEGSGSASGSGSGAGAAISSQGEEAEDAWAPAFGSSAAPVTTTLPSSSASSSSAAAGLPFPVPAPPPGLLSTAVQKKTATPAPASAPAPVSAPFASPALPAVAAIPRARQAVASTSLFAAQTEIGLVPQPPPTTAVSHHSAAAASGRDFYENITALEHRTDAPPAPVPIVAPASIVVVHEAGDRSPAVTSGLLSSSSSSLSTAPTPVVEHAHGDAEAFSHVAEAAAASMVVSSPSGKLVAAGSQDPQQGGGSGLIGTISRRLSKVGGRRPSGTTATSHDKNAGHDNPFGLDDDDDDGEGSGNAEKKGDPSRGRRSSSTAARPRRPSIAETVASLAAQVAAVATTTTANISGRSRSRAGSAVADDNGSSGGVSQHSHHAEIVATFEFEPEATTAPGGATAAASTPAGPQQPSQPQQQQQGGSAAEEWW